MARFFKILLGLIIVLIISGTILVTGKQAEPFPADSQSILVLQPGALPVASYKQVFIDRSRPTNANGDYPGSNQRELPGMVWYPGNKVSAPYPLLVYSHGFSSNHQEGAYLAEQLASLGYVVVAVDYPLTNTFAAGGPDVKDVVNQPADVSFLIDTLLAAGSDANHPLYGMIDAGRIGVTGISLGGMTSTMAAFHPAMGDPRIAAALSIAGPTEQFTARFFQHRAIPFLMLATDTDALVAYNTNALPVLDKVAGSQLVTIHQASHTGFAGSAALLRWLDNPDVVGCYMVLSNVDEELSAEDPWFELLGSREQGINYESNSELCTLDPLPPVMNPLRQQMITSVVVSSFFQSQFASQPTVREAAARYLAETLAAELGEVDYQQAQLAPTGS